MKGKGIKTTIVVAMLTLHHLCTITHAQTVTPTLTAAEESALRNSAAPPQDTVLWLSKGLINIHFSQVQLNLSLIHISEPTRPY